MSFEKALLTYYCTICISWKAIKLGDLFRLSFWTSTYRDVLSFGSSHSQRGQYLTSVEFLRGFSSSQNRDLISPSRSSLLIEARSSVHESKELTELFMQTDVKEHKAPFVCYRSLTSALHSKILR